MRVRRSREKSLPSPFYHPGEEIAEDSPPRPPPPYPGLVITEAPRDPSPPPNGEILVESRPIGVIVTARTHQDSAPELSPTPSAPPPAPQPSRGVLRPHSESPFLRSVRARTQEEEDMEAAVSSLLNFRTSTPKTPGTTSRPERPPRIASRRVLPVDMPRPRPLRVEPPAAALGAPPQPRQEDEEDIELPDIPDTPASPTASDMTMISTLSTYYSDENEDDDEDPLSEYEYADPFEGEGAYSSTPPPSCTPGHLLCVPPAWGEKIPGRPLHCRCVLSHEEGRHHAIRCVRCKNAPGCCACIWGYMRSRYNSGCPLCRAGDPLGENPLGPDRRPRRFSPRREEETPYRRRRGRTVGGGLLVGVGRAKGRDRPRQERREEESETRRPQRARRGGRRGRGRAVTVEEEEARR